jgi:CsoR family transcriptional regulator, copper-sensing transcriptional repressor
MKNGTFDPWFKPGEAASEPPICMGSIEYLTGYESMSSTAPDPTAENEGATMTSVRDPERKRALVLRLKRVEGQLRGIQKLIETDADCEKVAQQLAAARKALDKTFFSMVGCVIAQGDLPPDDVADLLSRFS